MTTTTWADKRAALDSLDRAVLPLTICTRPDYAAASYDADIALAAARTAAMRRLRQENPDDVEKHDPETLETALLADADYLRAHERATRLRIAVEQATVELWFRALPRQEYNALVDKHPPTDEERSAGKKVHDETFAKAVIARCHVDRVDTGEVDPITEEPVYDYPHGGMSEDEAERYLTTWSQGDATALYSTAVAVNEVTRVDFAALGKGSGLTAS